MSDPASEADHVENAAVRAALEAFVAAEGKSGDAGSIDVLRRCLHGNLLLDITGSDLRMSEDGTSLAAGSTIRIATTSDPDGGTALVAFTSQSAIALTRSAAAQPQSMVQAGVDVLELVLTQDHQWLYLDPGGPSCAISRAEIDFALGLARNDAVRDALSVLETDPSRREVLLDALRGDGALLAAVDAGDTPPGVLTQDTAVRLRTSTLPDGRTAMLVFTSGPELAARCQGASIVTYSTADVLDMLRAGNYAGLVVNPAGPWAAVTVEELLG